MKIKQVLYIFLIVLLPVAGMATDEKDAERLCDNYVFNDVYSTYYNKSSSSEILKYVLGTKEKRDIYKDDLIKLCKIKSKSDGTCEQAYYGAVDVFGKKSLRLNILSFSLYLNNMEIFDAMVKANPNMRYLVDNALYMDKINLSNEDFMTNASILIENSMPGTLKDFVTKYKDEVNLRKISGRIHKSPIRPKPMDNLVRATKLVEKWEKEGNEERLFCAKKVLDFVQKWYDEHNDSKTIKEAKEYSDTLLKLAEENKIADIEPFQFTPSLDIFKIQTIEDNFTLNIEKQIDVIIEKIMHDFDLSAFGNQA